MHRCALPVLALCASFAVATPALAQAWRNFPAHALRGELQLTLPPDALLNGQPVRLAPGARLRGEDNLLLVSGALAGGRRVVHYTLDMNGQIHELWLLTDAERAVRPWPTTANEARTWAFDPLAQTWTRP